MKSLYKITLVFGIMIFVSSCHSDANPNYQYFPNMYEAVSSETYAPVPVEVFKNGKEGQLPAMGSINRGYQPFDYANTPEGYALAKVNLKFPLNLDKSSDKGKELYEIYCTSCHGAAGDGKGKLVEREKFLGVPNYKDREITEGSIFYVETYGLNAMGSHANQLSVDERWLVADYVLKLRAQ
jgi:cytochrome c1